MAADTINTPSGRERPFAPRVYRAHTSMSAAASLLADGTMSTRQRDAIAWIDVRLRNAVSISRMLAEAADQDWADASRAFYELSYMLDALADDLQAVSRIVSVEEGRA